MIRVVCGIIYKDDKIFIARRKEGKSMAGYWEFPGGKIESGEKEEAALKRELLEELGMTVEVKERIGSNQHDYQNFSIELIAYRCIFSSSTYELTDHDSYEWLYLKDLSNYNLAPADIPLLKLI